MKKRDKEGTTIMKNSERQRKKIANNEKIEKKKEKTMENNKK